MIGDLPVRCEVALVDVDEGMLNSCVEAILGVTSPPLVVLFNSRAKGTAVEGSDLDLLVVEEPADPTTWSRVQEMVRLRRCLPPLGVPVDVLVYATAEVERRRHSINHALADALRSGRMLYERDRPREGTAQAGMPRPVGAAGHDG